MEKHEIFSVIKRNILIVIPSLADKDINIKSSLQQLGANSLERLDIIIAVMEELNLSIPHMEITKASNLEDLVNILYQNSNEFA